MELSRPFRSTLYMPGANARALDKAQSLAADAVIFDLEDAVAPDAKMTARDNVYQAATQNDYGGRAVIIRVNELTSAWGNDDVKMAVAAHPFAILAPKISTPDDVAALRAHVPAEIGLLAMVELPATILAIDALAASAARYNLGGFVMGTNDLIKEMGAQFVSSRAPLMTALSLGVLAARAHGLSIIDGVFNDIENTDGFTTECEQGAAMGFDGKTLIHPSQIDIANRTFSPPPEDIIHAQNIIAAFASPQAVDKGVLRVDGKMVERLHLAMAQKTLARAKAIEQLEQGT